MLYTTVRTPRTEYSARVKPRVSNGESDRGVEGTWR
jgi:hypothetical protein